MNKAIARLLARGTLALRERPDRGAQNTVDIMLWVAVMIVVVGAVGAIFRNDLTAFFNSISYTIGFTDGE